LLVGLSLNDVCAYTPNILPPDTPAVLWLTAPTSAATVLAYVAAGLTVKLVKLKPPDERSAAVNVSSELTQRLM
jgi:hypothetical protein